MNSYYGSQWNGREGINCNKNLTPKRNDQGVLFCVKYEREPGIDDNKNTYSGGSFAITEGWDDRSCS